MGKHNKRLVNWSFDACAKQTVNTTWAWTNNAAALALAAKYQNHYNPLEKLTLAKDPLWLEMPLDVHLSPGKGEGMKLSYNEPDVSASFEWTEYGLSSTTNLN